MDSDSVVPKTVCVTGAAGFIGSWLVMRLLQRGYTVRAAVRDPDNMKKVEHLLDLPNADTHLTLWKADLTQEGSFDNAINGCIGVFHVATPFNLETKDPENEMIKPTINGLLDIMKACVKARTVRRLVYTSSAGTLSATEHLKPVIDETCWSDVEFCLKAKMTGWVYFVSKTLAEQEAWKFAKEHNMDFISVIPPHALGPFLMNSMPPSFFTSLSLITGDEDRYSILKKGHFVHLDDLCMCHIFLFEHPQAEGRYICSSHEATIHEIAKLLSQKYPEYSVPTKFRNIPEDSEISHFSTKKIKDLGFQFKYSLEDMFTAALDTCREKGLLPKSAKTLAYGTIST
ncbi:dihydroflavonol 4-reductase-like isoform X1 [Neltuma alba]|uniref:dihydroflavonol 4-reductase-like isoform X1 n=2 Tax=Neltuma alba TaxID=207710 RepID=UPI0010A30527|nr:dihydroflavonol 4-reductase-like isoform X1 [Prosopis alba]